MHKFLASFVMIVCGFLFLAFDSPPKLSSSKFSEEIITNEEFSIFSRLTYSCWKNDFKWTNENRWKLVEYPQNELIFISEESTAPDSYGGDLFQFWTFKALQPGTFNLIFQLGDDEMTVSIFVVP